VEVPGRVGKINEE